MEDIGFLMMCPMAPYLEQELDRRFKLFRFWNFPQKKEFLWRELDVDQGRRRQRACRRRRRADRLAAGLEIVANSGVGLDKIDLEKCREKGIRVSNTPDVLTEDVADLVIGLILGDAQADLRVRSVCEEWAVEEGRLQVDL
ncbi:hypothetical protein Acr_00g0090340 [Actinidia rufa]|uniref:D-isomer specific 2-hydroxyacid dehydrogenase catalytic domain-containing protein n=1 Tax=Actinidia rufa TaxID=165716 RepID=A0A7J0DYQ5_9ERIC|nr:hypothetical protein Acr_00g0090340 [Actinidia rufa]